MTGLQEIGMILFVAIVIGLCGAHNGFASDVQGNKETVIQGNNAFAFALYKSLGVKTEENLCFSPASVFTALSMTYAGAQTDTAAQMAQALHLPPNQPEIHQALGQWIAELNTPSATQQGYQIALANSMWGQQGYHILPAYIELLKTAYNADLTPLDFINDVDGAVKTINRWVAQNTQDKITELLQPNMVQDAVLVLTNALYFKGQWSFPFDPKNTSDAPFMLATGEEVLTPMMRQTASLNYTEDEQVQVLELPYGEQASAAPLSMILFLPKTNEGFAALEAEFSSDYVVQKLLFLKEQKVMIELPKFSLHGEFSLPETLKSLGMTDAFSLPPADFSGITGKPELYISEVVHKVVIEVNEEGSQAAGASGVAMSRGLVRMPSFRANHPFLFFIRDNRTQGMLFFGRVMNPKK